MVLRYFDPNVSGMELFRSLGTGRDGTRQTAIIRELRARGIRISIRYDCGFDRLKSAIDRGCPVVSYLNDLEHWIVVYGYGEFPQRVFVADPRPQEPCEQQWDDYGPRLGGFGIVCSQPQALVRPLDTTQLQLPW